MKEDFITNDDIGCCRTWMPLIGDRVWDFIDEEAEGVVWGNMSENLAIEQELLKFIQ